MADNKEVNGAQENYGERFAKLSEADGHDSSVGIKRGQDDRINWHEANLKLLRAAKQVLESKRKDIYREATVNAKARGSMTEDAINKILDDSNKEEALLENQLEMVNALIQVYGLKLKKEQGFGTFLEEQLQTKLSRSESGLKIQNVLAKQINKSQRSRQEASLVLLKEEIKDLEGTYKRSVHESKTELEGFLSNLQRRSDGRLTIDLMREVNVLLGKHQEAFINHEQRIAAKAEELVQGEINGMKIKDRLLNLDNARLEKNTPKVDIKRDLWKLTRPINQDDKNNVALERAENVSKVLTKQHQQRKGNGKGR
jgi:hypothetical protein